MTRFFLAISFVMVAASSASAQAQGRDACTRDASRFCRPYLEQGDMAVLACLQQNRSRISKGCQATLASHGR
jgi:hypothetical protein